MRDPAQVYQITQQTHGSSAELFVVAATWFYDRQEIHWKNYCVGMKLWLGSHQPGVKSYMSAIALSEKITGNRDSLWDFDHRKHPHSFH